MNVGQNGINLIKLLEGFREKAYPDPGGKWTIGFGSTVWKSGTPVKEWEAITLPQAEDLLIWHLEKDMPGLNKLLIGAPVNQNQFDVICSFVYQYGIGKFRSSTLLKKVRMNPDDPAIAKELARWNKIKNKKTGKYEVSPGLVKRRDTEVRHYFCEV